MLTSRPRGSEMGAKQGRALVWGGGAETEGSAPSQSRSWSFLSLGLLVVTLVGFLLLARLAADEPRDLSAYPWLYLRGDKPLAAGEETIEVVAVGDVMLGRRVGAEPRPFVAVAPLLRCADLTLGNLECVVTDGSETRVPADSGSWSALQASPSTVAHLRRAGFDVLGLANNHALDLGSAGLARTGLSLQAAGLSTVGIGPDPRLAFQPAIHELGNVRLAILAFNAVPDGRGGRTQGWAVADWDPDRVAAAVRDARHQADAVIVSVHWGYEYEMRVDPAQRDAAKFLLQAGADLVIGHHPHVAQAFEVDNGRCVAYSLGNFAFDQEQEATREGLVLRAVFDGEGLRAVQALPVQPGVRPRLVSPETAWDSMARLVAPQRSSFACGHGTCQRVEAAPRNLEGTPSALFWGGRIDLTGDGVPEHVRRVRQQVVIYSDDAEVWRSSPSWRVVDVALGDPNDDGRGEVVLALWRVGLDGLETPDPEKEQLPRSHPFIIGYRGGVYRTLWGGSAVSDPINELELGDVDGDRTQELIVLESHDRWKRAVSVWRWHGWGFSLIWRSDPGPYRDLSLGEDGIIRVIVEP